ncbi:hypothetical protein C8Q77DRAFT_610772 [Trametes polyzona]|nr:hypothetical protein C8Q77DRAFT_610772 [Trametes polyzona]
MHEADPTTVPWGQVQASPWPPGLVLASKGGEANCTRRPLPPIVAVSTGSGSAKRANLQSASSSRKPAAATAPTPVRGLPLVQATRHHQRCGRALREWASCPAPHPRPQHDLA